MDSIIKMAGKGEEESVTLSMVQELLEQTLYKGLLEQQRLQIMSAWVSKDTVDIKTSPQISQANLDDLKASKVRNT